MLLKKIKKIKKIKIYNNILVFNKQMSLSSKNSKLDYFQISAPKHQNHFKCSQNTNTKIISSGVLMKEVVKTAKFFKKDKKSLGMSAMILNYRWAGHLRSVFFCKIKNFKYKTYIWWKKYIYFLKPKIKYINITNAWNTITKKKQRIKKNIFKFLKRK